jgi:hypothetical protein
VLGFGLLKLDLWAVVFELRIFLIQKRVANLGMHFFDAKN